MKRVLLFTMMCLFGLFSLNAQETTFSFDFEGGTKTGLRVFQGENASHLCPHWSVPQDFNTMYVNALKTQYSGADGSNAVFSFVYDMLEDTKRTPDNYIVTTDAYLITETSTLEWFVKQKGVVGKEDLYAVVISETGEDKSFEVLAQKTCSKQEGELQTVSLKDYAGKSLYIGFHHYVDGNDGYAIIIDNIVLSSETTGDDNTGDDNTGETVTVPAEPTVTATATSDTSIVLVWNKVEGATSYKVHQGTETLADALEDTTYTVNGLEAETEYFFNVQACNEAGCSEYTGGTANATTLAATSDDNTGDDNTGDDNTGDDNTGDDNTGDDNTGDDNTGDDNTGDDNTGDDNTGDDNTGDDNTGDETTAVLATPVVTAVASDSSVVLTWNKIEGATSYNVFQDTVAIDTVAAPDTTFTVLNLSADSLYVFFVQAENADTVSAKSDSIKVRTLPKADDEGDEEEHSEYLIYEDFEDYQVGAKLAATKPEIWSTWENQSSEDAKVDSLNANKYAIFTYGVDQILSFGDITNGCYEVKFDLYVPTGKNAYYNILHEFAGSNSDWALQQYVHLTDDGNNSTSAPGHGTTHAAGNGVADITQFVFDTWMTICYVIDIDHDVAEFYFSTEKDTAKVKLLEWQWSCNSFNDQLTPNRKLDAMNFFPPSKTSEFYLDNLTVKKTSGETVVKIESDKDTISAGAMINDITSVEFTIGNEGNAITDYMVWIDYGVSEADADPFTVNYDAEIGDSTTVTGLGAKEPTLIEVGAMYPASAYARAAAGTKVTHLCYPFAEVSEGSGHYGIVKDSDVTFRIYGQGFNGQPGEVLAEKVVPYSEIEPGQFLMAEFDSAVVLTGFNVWATVSFMHPAQSNQNPSYPIAFDGVGSGLAPYGDLIRIGNEGPFYSANEAFSSSYGNIHIRMICEGLPVTAGWAELDKADGTLALEAEETINVEFSTFGLEQGKTYEAKIKFTLSNSEEVYELPLSLRVWGENVEEVLNNAYNIYPNPTTGMVTVEGENINYIAVYNSVGQLVKVVKTQDNIIDMSAYENGVYFFNVVDNAGTSSVQRVVVAK